MEEGRLSLTQTTIDCYINTFHIHIAAPGGSGRSFASGLNVILEQTDARERILEKLISVHHRARPVAKILVQRSDSAGNFVLFGPYVESSCFP
jgi:hypothetical protein